MIIAFDSASDPAIIRVCGHGRNALRNELAAACADHSNLIADLSEVAELDARDVADLLACLHVVLAKDGDLKVCGLQEKSRLIFEITRLFEVIDVCGSVEEARRSFALTRGSTPDFASIFEPIEVAVEHAA
jgi:anti-anti-sigma regulatory factor